MELRESRLAPLESGPLTSSAGSPPAPRRAGWKRWLLRLALASGALLVLVLGTAGVVLALNWTFVVRVWTYPGNAPITSVAWYEPKRLVRGGEAAPLPVADPSEIEIAPEAIAKALAYAEEKNSSGLLVLHKGKIVVEQYWRGHHAAAATDSASMAKTMLGLLIGIAVEEGAIRSEDQSAAEFLTEWAGDERSKITIRHLLQMCSGLRNDDDREDVFSDMIQMHLGTDMASVVLAMPAEQEPGSRFEYNNMNSQLLGILLMRATGKPYAEYLSEKLWRPLGAGDAQLWLDRPGGIEHTYCCLYATPRDWARVGLLFLNRGRLDGRQIVSRAWIDRMTTPSPLEADYGYHIWIGSHQGVSAEDRKEPYVARDMFYLDGSMKQRVYIIPSRQLVIVRVGENGRHWDESFLPNTIVRGLEANARAD